MHKWTYLRDQVDSEAELDARLIRWANLGWELVSVCYIGNDLSFARTEDAPITKPWHLFLRQPA